MLRLPILARKQERWPYEQVHRRKRERSKTPAPAFGGRKRSGSRWFTGQVVGESTSHSLSSAAFIINTAESDFRYTQVDAVGEKGP